MRSSPSTPHVSQVGCSNVVVFLYVYLLAGQWVRGLLLCKFDRWVDLVYRGCQSRVAVAVSHGSPLSPSKSASTTPLLSAIKFHLHYFNTFISGSTHPPVRSFNRPNYPSPLPPYILNPHHAYCLHLPIGTYPPRANRPQLIEHLRAERYGWLLNPVCSA